MLPFSLNNVQLDDLVPRLCLTIDQYFGTSRIHRFPDRVAFLLRPDCGMAYANMLGRKLSREIGSISLPDFESRYYELPPPDASDEFENAHTVLMQSMRDCIRLALMSSQYHSAITGILKQHSLAMTTIDYDDMETETPIQLIL